MIIQIMFFRLVSFGNIFHLRLLLFTYDDRLSKRVSGQKRQVNYMISYY